jgi:DNA-binding transcriptional regulator YiaG
MTWGELNEARKKLGLTEGQMAKLLRVGFSTYTGWGTRGKVPHYIAASVEAHLLLSQRNLQTLMAAREI